MSINSSATAYNFGQLGSVSSNTAKPIVPPQGMVISAIQFLADNTPTVLRSEVLETTGPNFVSTEAGDSINYNGVTEVNATDGTYAAGANITIASADTKIKVGQYVLLIAQGDTVDAGITVDSETPIPIYNGPNKQGVFVTAYANTTTSLQLSAQITPSSQSLVFLDNYNGAGGNQADGIVYPKGLTIVGRWTTMTPSADTTGGGVICYFGY
jgi:hypothetical protein|tara:strand:+ start:1077 stop:1712 length:636 start_codon:yes stop_codon:yes gene_type:complete